MTIAHNPEGDRMSPTLALPPAGVPLVFLDTETTSLDRDTRRVWDVGVIRREPDGTETRMQVYVADVDLSLAVPAALDVGQFYSRHPRFAPPGTYATSHPLCLPEAEVAVMVDQMTRGAYLLGIVPSFDEHSLHRMLARHGLLPADSPDPAWHYHLVDVAVLACGLLGLQPPYKPREVSMLLGVDPTLYAEHTALGDALLARDLYDAVLASRLRRDAAAVELDRLAGYVLRYADAEIGPNESAVDVAMKLMARALTNAASGS